MNQFQDKPQIATPITSEDIPTHIIENIENTYFAIQALEEKISDKDNLLTSYKERCDTIGDKINGTKNYISTIKNEIKILNKSGRNSLSKIDAEIMWAKRGEML